ncbi:ankyrin repeat domain-containing protein [Vibrio hyugaensis]|uniref:ankyrin repeat domain-containing protein n=1 Tax=Vibrio hyugaensis TaxID=1534743 RepID=UPI000CE4CD9B|nr:ankyrin repeat domain-containing protein [Vibrio hyugaensis]
MKKVIATIACAFLLLFILRPSEDTLMECALGSEIKIFSTTSCMSYFNLFGISDNLNTHLHERYSLSSVLNSPTEYKFIFAQKLIDGGHDTNEEVGSSGLPIHSAIINNDIEALKWLLDRGANPNTVDSISNMNAYEFIEFMQNKHSTSEREAMRRMLQDSYIS